MNIMRLKKGFVLREVAGETVVVPTGHELDFHGIITLNETAKTIWVALENETDVDALVNAVLGEFDVDEKTARAGVESFISKLKELDFLE